MELSAQQKKFVDFVRKESKKPVDVNDRNEMIRMVVLNLFELYLIAEKENDKARVAWNIYRIKDEIKKQITFWRVIEDLEEFERLVRLQHKSIMQKTKNAQERRHQKRDDFALTDEQWEETLRYFNYECAYCGTRGRMTFEHLHPFSKGGDFGKGNIIPCCSACNSSKNNKEFIEWYINKPFFSQKRFERIKEFIKSNKQLTLF